MAQGKIANYNAWLMLGKVANVLLSCPSCTKKVYFKRGQNGQIRIPYFGGILDVNREIWGQAD